MNDVKQRVKKVMPVSPGRPKGVPNKATGEVKAMIMEALDGAGGVEYLKAQAVANPKAFLTLVGKVLPLQVTGEGGGPVNMNWSINFVGPVDAG